MVVGVFGAIVLFTKSKAIVSYYLYFTIPKYEVNFTDPSLRITSPCHAWAHHISANIPTGPVWPGLSDLDNVVHWALLYLEKAHQCFFRQALKWRKWNETKRDRYELLQFLPFFVFYLFSISICRGWFVEENAFISHTITKWPLTERSMF